MKKQSKNIDKLTVVNHAASSIIQYIKDFIRGLIKLSLIKYDCDIFPENEYHDSQKRKE
jgi:hypothetical protein